MNSSMYNAYLKLSYQNIYRLRKFNDLLKEYSQDEKSSIRRIKANLFESPKINKYSKIKFFNPNHPNYKSILEKYINQQKEFVKQMNVLFWEPNSYDPEIPVLLKNNGFNGKIYLIGPLSDEIPKFEDTGLIKGNFLTLEESIEEIYKPFFLSKF